MSKCRPCARTRQPSLEYQRVGAIFAAIARISLRLPFDHACFTVKNCLPLVVLRSLLGVLLLAALGGCSAYHHIFHPYRLPTPKPSPEFVAQQKAAKQARKAQQPTPLFRKKSAKAPEEAATDVSSPTGGAVATVAPVAKTRTLPERATVRYDKAGLMKNKSQLMRRRIHKPSKPFRPWYAIRNFFKYGLHAKPNYSPEHRPAPKQPGTAPADALPDEAMPTGVAPAPAPVGKP